MLFQSFGSTRLFRSRRILDVDREEGAAQRAAEKLNDDLQRLL